MDIQQLLQQIFGNPAALSPNLLVNPGQTQARVPNMLGVPQPQALPQDQFGSRFAGVPPQPAPVLPPPVSVNDHPVAQAQPDINDKILGGIFAPPGTPQPQGAALSGYFPPAPSAPIPGGVDPMVTGSTSAMGAGSPGEIKRGPDGQMYQYAQTTGMQGATGDNGWIRTNQKPSGGGVFGSLASKFTDSGFKDRLGDMMLGWGMGGTPQESLAMGNKAIMAGNLTRKGKEQQNQTIEWLKGKGMDEGQAKLLAANPSALSEYLQTTMTPKKPIEVNGKLVDPTTFKVVADFSSPTSDWTKQTDNTLLNTKTSEVKTIPGVPTTKAPDFGDIAGVRKEVQALPSYKNLAQAAPIWDSMVKTSGNDSKASDLNLVYGLGKIMDPSSVVREGEMIMVKDTAGLSQEVLGMINSVNGGARLTPDTRAAIMKEAQTRIGSYKTMYDQDTVQFKDLAKHYNINERDILGDIGNNIADLPQMNGAPGATPAVGTVDGGFRFKGGNPADPNSWEKVQQ